MFMSLRSFRSLNAVWLLAALTLVACGGSERPSRLAPTPEPAPPVVSEMNPARPQSPYAAVLAECAFVYEREGSNDLSRACSMERLPLLGQEAPQISVELILSRTLVSHDWMAIRFEQLLEQLPADLLQLFQGVTAVVIGADIRPSYYWSATGAIYLDPARLWLLEREKNTISRAPDFRSDFDRELNFTSLGRYVKNDTYAWRSYSLEGPETERPLSSIVTSMAALLFHELAHANDYIPPARLNQLDQRLTVLEAAVDLEPDNISAQLSSAQPLNSDVFFGLAEVMFRGETASANQKALTAEDVGLVFESDVANDSYAYTSSTEDTAMLFEEVMMRYHFDLERDIAFTDRPADETQASCDDYVVRWGRRGWGGDSEVRARIELILPLFLGSNDVDDYLDVLVQPNILNPGEGWCANLSLGSPGSEGASISRTSTAPAQKLPALPERDRRRLEGHPHH